MPWGMCASSSHRTRVLQTSATISPRARSIIHQASIMPEAIRRVGAASVNQISGQYGTEATGRLNVAALNRKTADELSRAQIARQVSVGKPASQIAGAFPGGFNPATASP